MGVIAGYTFPTDSRALQSCIVPLQTSGNRLPFFCVHGVSGGVENFRELAAALGSDQPFFGIQSPPLGRLIDGIDTVEALADYYLEQIARIRPRGRFLLGGYSLGGRIAHAMARRLRERGSQAELLVLLDSRSYIGRRLPEFSERLNRYLQTLREGDARERLGFLTSQLNRQRTKLMRKWSNLYRRSLLNHYKRTDRPVPEDAGVKIYLNQQMNLRYKTPPYDGPAILLKVDHSFLHPDVHDGWQKVMKGDFRIYKVPGRHLTLLNRPYVQDVAEIILRRTDETAQRL